MMNILVVTVLLGCVLDIALGCSCARIFPSDVQDVFCRKDFVIKARVTGTKKEFDFPEDDMEPTINLYDENFVTYHHSLEILKVYRTTGNWSKIKKEIVTGPSHLCGAPLVDDHIYIIMGHYKQGGDNTYLGTSLCSINVDLNANSYYNEMIRQKVEEGIQC